MVHADRALGIFNKLVSGPLYSVIEEAGHIFSINLMWENLFNYLVKCSSDGSQMINSFTFYDEQHITKDEIYFELFKESNDPLFEALTQECLEIICCTCSVMVQSQLKDQLPGGIYHQPDSTVLEETKNCPRTNIVSERDFASYIIR